MYKCVYGNFVEGEVMEFENNIGIYNNANGKIKMITVNEHCSACGACMSYSDMFKEDALGKCMPEHKGIIAVDDLRMADIMDAIKLCPEQALSIQNVSVVKEDGMVTIDDLRDFVKNVLMEYTVPIPSYKKFKFRGSVPDVRGDGILGYSSSAYSSYDKAQRAGLNELKRVYFNNMDTLIKSMLAEYKNLVLRPLLYYEESEENCYYAEIKRISTLIHIFVLEVEAVTKERRMPADIEKIQFRPDLGDKGKNFHEVGDLEEWLYTQAQQDLESPDWYESWVEVIDWDRVETTRSGALKTIYEYKYHANDARREIEDHMESGAVQAIEDFFVDGGFKYEFQKIVKPLEDEVRQKGRAILNILGEDMDKKRTRKEQSISLEIPQFMFPDDYY